MRNFQAFGGAFMGTISPFRGRGPHARQFITLFKSSCIDIYRAGFAGLRSDDFIEQTLAQFEAASPRMLRRHGSIMRSHVLSLRIPGDDGVPRSTTAMSAAKEIATPQS